jgi:KaiC/GvpD/RAD55 family RecA-like ATPase
MTKLLLFSNYGELGEQEISYTVEHAYRNKQNEHGTVKIMQWALTSKITRKANKSAMDDYSKLVYDRAYSLYSHNVPEANWLSLVKFHWIENKGRGFTTMDEAEFERVLSLAKRDAKDDEKETKGSDIKVVGMEQMMLMEEDRIFNSEFYTTLIPAFDEDFGGGWMLGDVYAIVGQEGVYKSVYKSAVLAANANMGVPCLDLGMEMSMYQTICREAFREFGYNIPALLKSGQWTRNDYQTLVKALSERMNHNLFMHNKAGITCEGIITLVNDIKEQSGKEIKIIGIDGIGSLGRGGGEIEGLIENSALLKEVAKETNTAILVLSHTNSEPSKHFRSQDLKIRGGMKMRANFDATISHSLCVNKVESNIKENDYKYHELLYWARLYNKRGSGKITDRIIDAEQLRIRESFYRTHDLEHHEKS